VNRFFRYLAAAPFAIAGIPVALFAIAIELYAAFVTLMALFHLDLFGFIVLPILGSIAAAIVGGVAMLLFKVAEAIAFSGPEVEVEPAAPLAVEWRTF
jgi:hypothetical protein